MPATKPHPGQILLEEYLKPLKLSARRLAAALHVPSNRITDIVRGRRNVSADTALRLARYFATTPEFWLHLQTIHDLSVAANASGKAIERVVARHKSA